MFFNQIAFLTGKELISWPGLMSPRKTFTPKTHYSTVKHNGITLSATFNKKSASSNSITAIKKQKVSPGPYTKISKKSYSQIIDTNKQANNNSYHQLSIKRPTLFQLMIVSRETLNSKKREQKEDSSKVLFHVKQRTRPKGIREFSNQE